MYSFIIRSKRKKILLLKNPESFDNLPRLSIKKIYLRFPTMYKHVRSTFTILHNHIRPNSTHLHSTDNRSFAVSASYHWNKLHQTQESHESQEWYIVIQL